MAKNSFLVTRPNHEPTTKYLFAWAGEVIKKADEKNIFTIDLAGQQANKSEFSRKIKQTKPSFIYLNGHGSPNTVTGFDNQTLLTFADNEDLTKDKVVYALSCQSAKRLGLSCVHCGAKAYLGYNEDFVFVFEEEREETPLQDETAGYFLQASNDLALAVVEGKTTGEALQNSQENFQQNIVKFSLSEATAQERELLPYLLWNREHQVCLGKKDVKCEFGKKGGEIMSKSSLGLIVGIFSATLHLVWTLLVILNLAKPIMDFVYGLHFLNNPFLITGFTFSKAIGLLLLTFFGGYVLGYFLGWVWEKVEEI